MRYVYLLEATLGAVPLQPDPVTEYFSAARGDALPHPVLGGHLYRKRLARPLSISTQLAIDSDGTTPPGGRATPTFGEIVLANGDRALDALITNRVWSGRALTLKRGLPTDAIGAYVDVAHIVAEDITWDAESITITARDRAELLNVPLQPTLYAGTGGVEGGVDVKGRPKPVLLGKCQNVAPVPLDLVNSVYQVSSLLPIANQGGLGIAVYDKGVPLANGRSTTELSLATVFDWTPVPGQFITDNGAGLIRLGAPPAGTVTADVDAEMPLGFLTAFRPDTAAKAVRFVASVGGFTDADLDQASFQTLEALVPDPIGVYVTEPTTCSQLLDQLLASLPAGFWTFDGAGKVRVGALDLYRPPAAPAAVTPTRITRITDLQAERTAPRVQTLRLGRNRTWRVQTADELTPGSDVFPDTDPRRSRSSRDYAWLPTTIDDPLVPKGRALDVPTFCFSQSDGQSNQLARMTRLLGARRVRYQATVRDEAFQHRVGDVVLPVYPRWGLDGTTRFLVVSVAEEAGTERTTLGLWGEPPA